MRRKLFIGIALDGRVNTVIDRYRDRLQDIPVIWTPAEERHSVLVFLGYVEDDRLLDVCEGVSRALSHKEAFEIMMKTITIGPDKDHPKMIWLVGEECERLTLLRTSLVKEISSFAKLEAKRFRPHITLGRIQKNKEKITPSTFKDVSVHIPLMVYTITIFENVVEGKKRIAIPLYTYDLI